MRSTSMRYAGTRTNMKTPLFGLNYGWNLTVARNGSSSSAEILLNPANHFALYKDVAVCLGLCIAVVGKPKLVGFRIKFRSVLLRCVCSIGTLVALPLLSLVFTVLGIYREMARSILLATKHPDGHVVDLLHGTDMFWALEDQNARSVINILSLIDFGGVPVKRGMEPLKIVKEIMRNQLGKKPLHCWKLLCHRKLSRFGYYYWEKQNKIRLEDHINWMELDYGEGEISQKELNEFVSSVVNKELPLGNLSCWEIYVGRRPVAQSVYPVLFRIHHTVGDGMALVSLLVNSLAQNAHVAQRTMPAIPRVTGTSDHRPPTTQEPKAATRTVDVYEANNIEGETKEEFLGELCTPPEPKVSKSVKDVRVVLSTCDNSEFMRKFTFAGIKCVAPGDGAVSKIVIEGSRRRTSVGGKLVEQVAAALRKGLLLLLAPVSLYRQATGARDDNALHGPQLSGSKLVAWHFEGDVADPRQRIMAKIRRIRDKTGTRFSDVLFTALSQSFESYYALRGDRPHDITVVVPSRIGRSQSESNDKTLVLSSEINVGGSNTRVTRIINSRQSNGLTNAFTFGLLRLPIAGGRESGVFRKLDRVRGRTEELRTSGDQLVNYWLLDVVLTLLPAPLVRALVRGLRCTMAVSNLPGPPTYAKFGSYKMQDIVFWVPNKENSGIGLTVLSYAGKINLGILSDKALIPTHEDLQLILNGILLSIDSMDKTTYPS
ncbi:hypothetical protein AAG570_013741 [Ranatra chinensis]|uniref:O-acyltransferase WSD1 C-terminal domain-containing protein n=1 Tax=Ranatra chinensis TaxID=642074 RepID=A0ABD0YD23_9HEMI